ncbi:glycogen synthase GlgA [Noviherbaspirillum autotrophicum]|uniref:Glycogen synthase n=1 Tax=Noviherbaspirillum autotrophicum TaxID=709839 RepID=A0A0C1Y9D2_9BURK|nr:glycogen synthase GlgA [Noviherbaspirillum autotrophicum]KIF83578.1 glycogen synthase [Noviherbaspirillum autotrophicum]
MNARILIVCSEAVPLVKTGGLADVITSLARTLRRRGIDATVMMPGYPAALEQARNLEEAGLLADLPGGPGRLLHGMMPDQDIPVLLLRTAGFERRISNPYVDERGEEFPDNASCFGALAHAAVAVCRGQTSLAPPHVVHANDWHAGLIPALLRLHRVADVGTLFTIHNLAFQGNFPVDCAAGLGIPQQMLGPDGMEFWGKLSFLKAGIRYADRISTVSDTYAAEILTPRFGHGMDGLLNERRNALLAIRNGVDTEAWNPAGDALIARSFTLSDLRGKSSCKRELQTLFELPPDPFAPILAMGSRITHQKMADVALASLPAVLQRYPRAQLIVLGRGDRTYEQDFVRLAQDFPERAAVHIGYDEMRAHALHAGADMLLHGSRFEPFGLTPLYSMHYGTIPIASRVGGIVDTVVDAGLSGLPPQDASGILFDGEAADGMTAAVSRAFALYENPAEWHPMQCNAMSADFSWSQPAEKYIAAYRDIAAHAVKELFVAQPEAPETDLPEYKTA